jgi:alpha-galactosidase
MRAKTLFVILLTVMIAGTAVCAAAETDSPAQWLSSHFKKNGAPPFSFKYDGHGSESFIRSWDYDHQEKPLDANRTQHIYTYTDPATKLLIRAECVEYKDFPAVEWVLKIKNNSETATPIIEDIQALDTVFKSATSSRFMLHHSMGAHITREDFAPVDTPFRSVESIRFMPNGGRPSDIEAFPFFNLEDKPFGGTMIAIGWTGQWAATFSRVKETGVHARAGMALTHLKLYAGEEIRTPRILLMFWSGEDYIKGQNAFRRIILAHYSPQKDGKTVTLPLSFSVHGTYVFNDTTEKNMVELAGIAADRFKNIGFEYFWIDAGWYKDGWPTRNDIPTASAPWVRPPPSTA